MGVEERMSRANQLPVYEEDDPGLEALLRFLMSRCCMKHRACAGPDCKHGDHVLEAHELRAAIDVGRAGAPFGREQLRCELLNFTGSKRSRFLDPETPEYHAARLLETAYAWKDGTS